MIGRNEQCPCGSGKKYKRCCLQKNQLIEFTKNKILYAKGLYNNMESKIYEYSNSSDFHNDKIECKNRFYVSNENNSIIDKQYSTYFMYDYKTYEGNTVVKKFINDNMSTLNRVQKNILSSILKSNISIFRVEEIESTKLVIRDYFNNNKTTIEYIESLKNIKVGGSIIARVINIQGINILLDNCINIPDKNLQVILNNISQLYKSQDNQVNDIKEFVNLNSELVYKFAQQILLNHQINIENVDNSKLQDFAESKLDNNLDVNIYDVLKSNIESKYLQKGLELWRKFINSKDTIKGSQNGWAAAIEYYIKKDAGEVITQAQISQKYEISPRTLGKRYKDLKVS